MGKGKVAIIGGGASGMIAAISAAMSGASVTVFERGDKVGRKLLMTGNGKCNLTNKNISAENYYCDVPGRLSSILERFGYEETVSFFYDIGLLTYEKNGYYYPMSNQASSVQDALRFRMKELGVEVRTNCLVQKISSLQKGGFAISYKETTEDHRRNIKENFDACILSCGGRSVPKTGSDGSGYDIANALGHSIRTVRPALCALTCEENIKAISGVRATAEVTLYVDDKKACSETGELQLTDSGISGIPVFQISHVASKATGEGRDVHARIDFLPGLSAADEKKLRHSRHLLTFDRTADEYFVGMINKKLIQYFMSLCHISARSKMSDVLKFSYNAEDKIWKMCRNFDLKITGTVGYENSQTSMGGVPLSEVNDRFESDITDGLFLTGEMLDVDGKCGGFNLQWAWCTGYIAGEAAAEYAADADET